VVLNIDSANKRISLGLKQVDPNPWDIIGEKYPVGTTIEGKINNITDFGIFIGIDEGIDGLVHISDIFWGKRNKPPSILYKKGQPVQAVVLNIDKENKRLSLGIKQLTPDPWNEVPEKYKRGTRVTGRVTNVSDFGVFIELEEGVEGLIHVSEISEEKRRKALLSFRIDDVIQAEVINVARDEEKIGLSVRKLKETTEKDSYRKDVNNQGQAKSNPGKFLKEGVMDLGQKSLSERQESEQHGAVQSESDGE